MAKVLEQSAPVRRSREHGMSNLDSGAPVMVHVALSTMRCVLCPEQISVGNQFTWGLDPRSAKHGPNCHSCRPFKMFRAVSPR